MRTNPPYFVLYDGDCRICTLGARILHVLDLHRNLHVRPIQQSMELLRSIPEDAVLDAAHAVAPDGHVTTGADAMPTLVGALLDAPRFEGWLRASKPSMTFLNRFYATLVELRGRLTCALPAPSSAARSPR